MISLKTKVLVAGAKGKMGKEMVKMFVQHPLYELVGGVDRTLEKVDVGETVGLGTIGVSFFNNLQQAIEQTKPDVLVDVTNPEVVYQHVIISLENNIPCVIGTSGLSEVQINTLKEKAREKEIGVLIVPNFSLGAILMMKFSQTAARYYQHVDIIEKHNHLKKDAPSGTAKRTLEQIKANQSTIEANVHSVRLPSLIAHQEVTFGGEGELLTIKHDSMNRESFMPGVRLAIDQVLRLKQMEIGLEKCI